MELKSRDTQTQVKHTIHRAIFGHMGWYYLYKSEFQSKGCAKSRYENTIYILCMWIVLPTLGQYAGDTLRSSEPVYGSPIIGIKALDKVSGKTAHQVDVKIRVNSILIEKEPKAYCLMTWKRILC